MASNEVLVNRLNRIEKEIAQLRAEVSAHDKKIHKSVVSQTSPSWIGCIDGSSVIMQKVQTIDKFGRAPTDGFSATGLFAVAMHGLSNAVREMQIFQTTFKSPSFAPNDLWLLQVTAYSAITMMRNVLDHLMWLADKVAPSPQKERRTDWYFGVYSFACEKVEFMFEAQSKLNQKHKLFFTIANEAKHEAAWFGFPSVKEGYGTDIWLMDEDGTSVGLWKGVVLPVYRIIRQASLHMKELVNGRTPTDDQMIGSVDLPDL